MISIKKNNFGEQTIFDQKLYENENEKLMLDDLIVFNRNFSLCARLFGM